VDAALKAEKDYLVRLQLREKETTAAERARTSLLDFTFYTNKKYEANWHHRVVCAYLDAFAVGRIRRLMVFLPPRHGKSELVSRRLPPYLLGRNPDEQIVLASYAHSLANSMNLDAQQIMDSDEYKSVFPGSCILQRGMQFEGKPPKRKEDYVELTGADQFGYFKTVGVGGGLTGFGFTRGIIDDPFKNREEADSETTRESVWKWYTSTFSTRQGNDYAGICLLQTRWHEDDLAGRLLQQAQDDPNADQWVVLKLPAMATETPANKNDKRKEGEALWGSKFPVPFLVSQKSKNARDWAALYQQSPYTEGGAILKKHYWQYYDVLPRYLDEQIISVDATFKDLKDNDFVAMQVWGRKGADKYLIDQYKDRMDFVATCNALLGLVRKYPAARAKYIEDKANGPAVISAMKSRISGLIPVEPEGSKVARAQAVSPQCESGNVYLPRPEAQPWVNEFVDECAKFPNAKNDDQVDACTQALFRLETSEGLDLRQLTKW